MGVVNYAVPLCAVLISIIIYRYVCNTAIKRFINNFSHHKSPSFEALEEKLKSLTPQIGFPLNITLSVQGGGWKNSYSMGALYMLNSAGVSIHKAAGASTGSWVAYASLTCTDKLRLWYNGCAAYYDAFNGHAVNYEIFTHFLESFSDENITDGALEVSTARLAFPLFAGNKEASFNSLEHLRRSLLASTAIPFYTTWMNLPFVLDGGQWYVDGGIWDNEPVHSEFAQYSLVALRTDKVTTYGDVLLMSIQRAEDLMIQGAHDMAKVLEEVSTGIQNTHIGGITWIDRPDRDAIKHLSGRSALDIWKLLE